MCAVMLYERWFDDAIKALYSIHSFIRRKKNANAIFPRKSNKTERKMCVRVYLNKNESGKLQQPYQSNAHFSYLKIRFCSQ